MKKWIIRMAAICAVTGMVAACTVSEAESGKRPTLRGKILYDYVDGHMREGIRMTDLALTFNEYYKQKDQESGGKEILDRYFISYQIQKKENTWYFESGYNVFRIVLKDGLGLDEPGALWKVMPDRGQYPSAELSRQESGEYAVNIRTSNWWDMFPYSEWLITTTQAGTEYSYTLTGKGEMKYEDDPACVITYEITTPLAHEAYDNMFFTQGGLQVDYLAPESGEKDQTKVEFSPFRKVKIIYHQMEEWWRD